MVPGTHLLGSKVQAKTPGVSCLQRQVWKETLESWSRLGHWKVPKASRDLIDQVYLQMNQTAEVTMALTLTHHPVF